MSQEASWAIVLALVLVVPGALGYAFGGWGVIVTAVACLVVFGAQLYGGFAEEAEGALLGAFIVLLLLAPVATGVSTAAWNLRTRRRTRRSAV